MNMNTWYIRRRQHDVEKKQSLTEAWRYIVGQVKTTDFEKIEFFSGKKN